jgi:hypothetical protein
MDFCETCSSGMGKRVFNIDIEVCTECCGPVKVLANIEDPAVILTMDGHMLRRPWMAGSSQEDPRAFKKQS